MDSRWPDNRTAARSAEEERRREVAEERTEWRAAWAILAISAALWVAIVAVAEWVISLK
jgi:hypothetical protein